MLLHFSREIENGRGKRREEVSRAMSARQTPSWWLVYAVESGDSVAALSDSIVIVSEDESRGWSLNTSHVRTPAAFMAHRRTATGDESPLTDGITTRAVAVIGD